jgi:hypothetical protein
MQKSVRDDFNVNLDVVVFVDPTKMFTVANVASYDDAGTLIEGVGVAKRNPEDEYDPEIGWGLAIKRALNDLADKFSEY